MIRKICDRLVWWIASLCAAMMCAGFLGLSGLIVQRSLLALGHELLWTTLSRLIFPALGTLILISTAMIIAGPFSVGVALCEGWYRRGRSGTGWVMVLLSVFNGMPPIVLGIFG